MKLSKSTICGLDCLTITRINAAKTVIMLHGYGANMEDLASLHQILDPRELYHWIFPNGPLAVPIGPHQSGQAWFPIRMADLEAAALRGEIFSFEDARPDGLITAAGRIIELIQTLRIPSKELIVGGFSQGSMVACQAAWTLPDDIGGLLLFSGTCINASQWREQAKLHQTIKYFQSHGKSDPVLAYKYAVKLNQLLTAAGLQGEFFEFDGYHEIPMPVLRAAMSWLAAL